MGSPVSVIVANLVTETIEERALATFSHSFQVWARYINDTSAIILKKHLHHLNLVETTIKFTLEAEKNGNIS